MGKLATYSFIGLLFGLIAVWVISPNEPASTILILLIFMLGVPAIVSLFKKAPPTTK